MATNEAQIVIRVPRELADALKAMASELEAQAGVPVSVAAVARKLLAEAIEARATTTRASKPKRTTKR